MRLFRGSAEAIIMVFDVVRGYLSVAGGLTDISLQRAKNAVDALLSQSSDVADRSSEQITSLAEDFVKQSQVNRDLLVGLIRTEVDRTVGRMGFVREEELAAVRSHVLRLEAQLKAGQKTAAGAGTRVARTTGGAAARKLAGAPAAVVPGGDEPGAPDEATPEQAAPAAAPDAVTAADSSDPSPSQTPVAKKAAAKRTPARKTAATKTVAKKAAAAQQPQTPLAAASDGDV